MEHALAIIESVRAGDPVEWDTFVDALELVDVLLAEVARHEGQRERSEEIRLVRCENDARV